MRVRILGCGTSTGVPRIGNDWGLCDPGEPRNERLRSSILVETGGKRLLVDCGPDLRQQLLSAGIGTLDAVIVTHTHADHCHGIDELRPIAGAIGKPIPVYGRASVLAELDAHFGYAFARSEFYRPIVEGREIGEVLAFGEAKLRFVDQPHGQGTALGIRIDEPNKSLVYAIDYNDMTDDMMNLYKAADVMISDCLTRRPHPTHADLDSVLGWASDLDVGQLFLSHMGNGLDYRTLCAELPDWAAPSYDGMEIEL